jgi:tRNA (guanine26-N2/guanine27-N2)-dimethyltransferase
MKEKVELVTEGVTPVFVFKEKDTKRGPGSKGKLPFYNPAMELNRDLSILVGQWFVDKSRKRVHLLDGLAASGIRGIRLANELEGDFEVTINDWDKDADGLIKKNIKKCKLENVSTANKNLNVLLSENKYDYIDVDPFGSPVYFIDSAIRSIRNNGILACTATDVATLCGVYPKVCQRRYSAYPFHSPMMHEVGLRILVGFICREATKYDKGIEPLVCYSTDHYFRVYTKVRNGTSYANESVRNVSMIKQDELLPTSNESDIGPLWVGRLQNKNVVKELRTILFDKKLNTKHMIWKLLDLLEEESDASAFFYTTDYLASILKTSPPRMKKIFEKLREKDYIVTRTHFSPNGFKTNAPLEEIKKMF